MKTKKFLTTAAILTLSTVALAACSADNKKNDVDTEVSESSDRNHTDHDSEKIAGADLHDGTYKLEEKNEKNNYRTVFTMTVKNGEIIASDYDNINADGESKITDKEYNEKMEAVVKTSPEKFIPLFNEELVKTQNPADMDVVTGATHSFTSFQNYAQQLIQAAQAGDTKTIEIDNGAELKDGSYTLKEKNDANGYHTEFTIVVENGKIVESNYDNVSADGKSKKDDVDYNENMKEKTGVGPKEYIEKLNEEFIQIMDEEDKTPADMDVVTGATNSYHSFIAYAEQLINAAEKGDTKEIIVDNIILK